MSLFNFEKLEYDTGLGLPSGIPRRVFREQGPLSTLQEPMVEYSSTCNYLNINSGDRDTVNYPLHYDYSINLDTVYENVSRVELLSIIFPNVSGITSEPYLVLDVIELNTIDFALNSKGHSGFAVCPLKNPNQASGGYVLAELGCSYHIQTDYKTPRKISRLTVKIRNSTGDLFDFGKPSGSSLKADQHSFVVKITTKDVCRKVLEQRNVY